MTGIYCHDIHGEDQGPLRGVPRAARVRDAAPRPLRLRRRQADLRQLQGPLLQRGDARRVREMMRYAGPRMLWRHPVLAIRHLLDGRRPAPDLPARRHRTCRRLRSRVRLDFRRRVRLASIAALLSRPSERQPLAATAQCRDLLPECGAAQRPRVLRRVADDAHLVLGNRRSKQFAVGGLARFCGFAQLAVDRVWPDQAVDACVRVRAMARPPVLGRDWRPCQRAPGLARCSACRSTGSVRHRRSRPCSDLPTAFRSAVSRIEVLHVDATDALHGLRKAACGPRRGQQVDMVGHEDVGMKCHAVLARRIFDARAKEGQVVRTAEDGRPIISSLDDVQRKTGDEKAWHAGHAPKRMAPCEVSRYRPKVQRGSKLGSDSTLFMQTLKSSLTPICLTFLKSSLTLLFI